MYYNLQAIGVNIVTRTGIRFYQKNFGIASCIVEDIQKYELIFLEFANISHVIKCVLHCAIPNRSTSLFIYIYIYLSGET